MTIAELFHELSCRGLSLHRKDVDHLAVVGDADQLTPDLRESLYRQQDELFRIFPWRSRERVSTAVEPNGHDRQ